MNSHHSFLLDAIIQPYSNFYGLAKPTVEVWCGVHSEIIHSWHKFDAGLANLCHFNELLVLYLILTQMASVYARAR